MHLSQESKATITELTGEFSETISQLINELAQIKEENNQYKDNC